MTKLGPLHPLGRVAETNDITSAILFLASETASFISGVDLLVDGARGNVIATL